MLYERKLPKIIAPFLALSIGLTACGSDGRNQQPEKPEIAKVKVGDNAGDFEVEYEYTPTGKRITTFSGPQDGGAFLYPEKIAYCEGNDFVEDTLTQDDGDGAAGGSTERILNHPACADGKLQPKDFTIPG